MQSIFEILSDQSLSSLSSHLYKNMTIILFNFFSLLPEEIQRIILEFNPHRRLLCNEMRLFTPYWFARKGLYTQRFFMSPEDAQLIKNKLECVYNISLAGSCDNCNKLKTPRLMLEYIAPSNDENWGGLFCETCLNAVIKSDEILRQMSNHIHIDL